MKKIVLFALFASNFWQYAYASPLLSQSKNIGYSGTFLDEDVPTIACPKEEVRAVWLTTIGGLDWPHSYSQSANSAKKQQEEFCKILDKLAAAGINTVLLQTRIRATTIFPSDYEPWDGALSGFPDKSPGYDALAFCIEQCHLRGMKLHAWVVCIPAGKWNGTGCKRLRRTHPNMMKKVGDEGFLNPEKPETATYLADFCADIARRYDVDGIHLDYIRYPDGWGKIRDKEYGRECITRIVREVHDAVKAEKKWIALSCSPVGKYADTKRQWSHGWNARDAVCQDAVLWLERGYMDMLFPMMYFRGENFYPFAIDWKERSVGKTIAPGLGIYFMHPRESNWALDDITRELEVTRQYGLSNCMFRSKFFTDNTKGIYNYFQKTFATSPSTQPALTWLSSTLPATPTGFNVKKDNEDITLKWDNNGGKYNIYGSDSWPVDTHKGSNLLATELVSNSITFSLPRTFNYFAVTTVDRYGNESEAVQSTTEVAAPNIGNVNLRFTYDNSKVWLRNSKVYNGQLIIVRSIVGNDVASSLVNYDSARGFYIDVANLTPGHYKLYAVKNVGKKTIEHPLGWLSVPLK